METSKREFKQVPARKIRSSSILPMRDSYDPSLVESIKKDGVQQPLIVRPDPNNPDEYEIIDGHVRRLGLKDEDNVIVDVRYGLKDSEVFRLSNMTYFRKGRSTYEKARFIAYWIRKLADVGDARGAQARVAKDAHISEPFISQYVTIYEMFRTLETLPEKGTVNFDALKIQGVNRLYELSKLTEHPSKLLQVSQQLSNQPEMPLEKLKGIVNAALEEANAEEDDQITNDAFKRLEEDPEETELQRKAEQNRTVKLTEEMVKLADETKQGLTNFETQIKMVDAKSLNTEVLKVLAKLQRRFKRLQKEISKLGGYILEFSPK